MKKFFKSERGAFDLGSIMVGLIITGIVAGVSAAALFLVKPWFDNRQAVSSLNAIQVAEKSALQDNNQAYLPVGTWDSNGKPVAATGLGTLASGKYLASPLKTQSCVIVGTDASGYATYEAWSKGSAWYKYTSGTDKAPEKQTSAPPATCK